MGVGSIVPGGPLARTPLARTFNAVARISNDRSGTGRCRLRNFRGVGYLIAQVGELDGRVIARALVFVGAVEVEQVGPTRRSDEHRRLFTALVALQRQDGLIVT